MSVMKKEKRPVNKQESFKNFLLKKGWKFRNDIVANRLMWCRSGDNYEPVVAEDVWQIVQEEHGQLSMDYILYTIRSSQIAPLFNPLKFWLENLTCDNQKDYVRELCTYVVLENSCDQEKERLYVSLKKWFVGAIKTIYDPFYVHKQAVIFSGKKSIGKTPFTISLLPKSMSEFIKYAPPIGLNQKDADISLTTSFILVFDEIDDYFKSKTNREYYKSWMTRKWVNVRPPFGKTEVKRQRFAAFIGSCNEASFLNEPTGTPRFSIFGVEKFLNKRFGGDKFIEDFPIERIWAQAYALFKEGFDPEYTSQQLTANEQANEEYKYNSPEYEALVEWFEPAKKGEDGAKFMTAADICAFLDSKQDGVKLFNVALGKALTRLGCRRSQHRINGGNPVRGYYVRCFERRHDSQCQSSSAQTEWSNVITPKSLDKSPFFL